MKNIIILPLFFTLSILVLGYFVALNSRHINEVLGEVTTNTKHINILGSAVITNQEAIIQITTKEK